jgi:hypothetical protein
MPLGHGALSSYAIGGSPLATSNTVLDSGQGVLPFAGSFILAASPGNQRIDVGFQGKVVIFWSAHMRVVGTANEMNVLIGAASGPANRWVSTLSHNVNANKMVNKFDDTQVILFKNATDGAALASADFASFDATGFNINVTKTDTVEKRRIHYLVLGGQSISAYVTTFNSNTAVGAQSIVGFPFQPKAGIFVAGARNTTNADILNTLFQQSFGVATSATSRFSNCITGVSSATSITKSSQSTSGCLQLTDGTVVQEKMDFTSNDAAGMTFNWVTKSATAFKVGVIALGGQSSFACGTLAEPAVNGNQDTAGLAFQPLANIFSTTGSATGLGIVNNAIRSIGAATLNTNQTAAALLDANGSTSIGVPKTTNGYDLYAFLLNGSANESAQQRATYTKGNSNGFSLAWENTDASAFEVFFLAIGKGAATAYTKTVKAIPVSAARVNNRSLRLAKKATSVSVRVIKKRFTAKKFVLSTSVGRAKKRGIELMAVTSGSVVNFAIKQSRTLKYVSSSIKLLAKKLAAVAPMRGTTASASKVKPMYVLLRKASSGNSTALKRQTQKAFLLSRQILPNMKKTGLRTQFVTSTSVARYTRKILDASTRASSVSTASISRLRPKMLAAIAAGIARISRGGKVNRSVVSLTQSNIKLPRLLYKQQRGVVGSTANAIRQSRIIRAATLSAELAIITPMKLFSKKLTAVVVGARTIASFKGYVRKVGAVSPVAPVIRKGVGLVRTAYQVGKAVKANALRPLPKKATGTSAAVIARRFTRTAKAIGASASALKAQWLRSISIKATATNVAKRASSYLRTLRSSSASIASRAKAALMATKPTSSHSNPLLYRKIGKAFRASVVEQLAIRFGYTKKVTAANASAGKLNKTAMPTVKRATQGSAAAISKKKIAVIKMLGVAHSVLDIFTLFTSGGLPVPNQAHTIVLQRRIRKLIVRLRNRA